MSRTGDARDLAGPPSEEERQVGWRRLRGPVTVLALVASAVGALGQTLGTVVAGRLADAPTARLLVLLTVCVVGAALLDTAGRFAWSAVVDRAEGRLRGHLLSAAMHQPLPRLSEQAVGEVMDRVDDDTWEIGSLVRRQVWDALRTAFAVVPMWIVAGLTWWPAWILFPVFGVASVLVVRPLLGEISDRKVAEEIAWTDHAAALEEGIASRDDLRTSLGQAHVVGRLSSLSATVFDLLDRALAVQRQAARRAGVLLHVLLAAMAVGGVVLAMNDGLSVAQLVTLFLVTSTFVGMVSQLAQSLPELEAGVGAVVRIRQLLEAEPEPEGGRALPTGPLDLELRDLHFSYEVGGFALRDVDLVVPAGTTCALVGRTGSGKSTLASLLSRAADPEPGTVLLGGVDVLELDLQQLRASVGVVTQRTEILAGTLAENIALFADLPLQRIEDAVAELGLADWAAGLPDGLDTLLGPGGTALSAGEEQLVAFARLLVRDVGVVVLDEATALMDPLTEALVVRAADRLLGGRTGILVAHRLGTTNRADAIAVLEAGRLVQHGPRTQMAREPGLFRDLLLASSHTDDPGEVLPESATAEIGAVRRTGPPPDPRDAAEGPSLARGIARAMFIHPAWGLLGGVLFVAASVVGAYGAVTGLIWGTIVQDLQDGGRPVALTVALVVSLLAAPLLVAVALRRYVKWWVAVMLRVRLSVLLGQTAQRRLDRTPAGEVVARSMDADRFARYADSWVDLVTGSVVVVLTAVLGGSLLAGGVLLAVMVGSALLSAAGRPIAGRSATASSAARARFGRSVVSVLESARTVKLAAATADARAHLRDVDGGRVEAAVFEHRVQAVLDGAPVVLVQCGVVAAWATFLLGGWDLATALLVTGAVRGFDWFGRVAGAVITEAPGTRSWQVATTALAGGGDLMDVPRGVDLLTGSAPPPVAPDRVPLRRLELHDLEAVHQDGTRGATGVDLTVERGDMVLLLGQVGSGKSSLLAALAGLVDHRGTICWNGEAVDDPETFLRPGQVAHVAQVPRVLSGALHDNIRLGHDRGIERAIDDASLVTDVEAAGGPEAVVGHRGVRLSGGQVQRLALARALAAETELLLADDVSSAVDATTEIELWDALRRRGTTVIGATSKRAALARADRVVVLVDGAVAAEGPWSDLEREWSHLAG